MALPPIQSSVHDTGANQSSAANELGQRFGGIDKSVDGITNTTLMVVSVVVAVTVAYLMRKG